MQRHGRRCYRVPTVGMIAGVENTDLARPPVDEDRLSALEQDLADAAAALQAIETWSSCIADVGNESTLAGAARRRFSAHIAAAV